MKNLIRLEELVMFLLSIYLFSFLDYAWWIYLLLILTPDIGMLGYLINAQVGALTYNMFHHKGIALFIGFMGLWWSIPELQLASIILFGHASMDRIFGYGLKFSDNFKHTHLGDL
ncbi:DUF4260 domain-containing protein [Ekhidna sp.]|uniref:DUF4260 domain-containing protein n=1 Tax=Ekhidna sp. TaxID=2608089 RepID=UPI003B506C18